MDKIIQKGYKKGIGYKVVFDRHMADSGYNGYKVYLHMADGDYTDMLMDIDLAYSDTYKGIKVIGWDYNHISDMDIRNTETCSIKHVLKHIDYAINMIA